jgi:hypothetical protein
MTIKETGLFFPSKGEEAIRLEGILRHPAGKDLPAAVIGRAGKVPGTSERAICPSAEDDSEDALAMKSLVKVPGT